MDFLSFKTVLYFCAFVCMQASAQQLDDVADFLFGASDAASRGGIAYASVRDITIRPFRKRPPSLQYMIRMHENEFNITLLQNSGLAAHGCIVHHHVVGGPKKLYPCAKHNLACYYTGKSESHNESWVAANVCGGLTGVLSLENISYYFDPLNSNSSKLNGEHLHRVFKFQGKPHKCAVQAALTQAVHQTRTKRAADSQNDIKYIELRMVVEPRMVYLYHSVESVENYTFMVLNIANTVYQHKSLGQVVQLSIKEFHILESLDDELASSLTPNVERSLWEFCQWTSKQANTVDANVLITRINLRDDSSDSVTGFSYQKGICKKNWNCALVEDAGPIVGITIAHEMGHLLGMSHDTDLNNDKIGIMSPGGWSGAQAFRWSKQSAEEFRSFSQDKKDPMRCLKNTPVQVAPNKYPPVLLPGTIYSPGDQCRLTFHDTAYYAPDSIPIGTDPCTNMYCGGIHPNSNKATVAGPFVDGTDCFNNRSMCMGGRCVPIGIEHAGLPRIDGAWSEWSKFTQCSRSCNGGITMRRRKCNNPLPQFGGKDCVGISTSAQLCNLAACKPYVNDRERQCNDTGPNNNTYCSNYPGKDSCLYHVSITKKYQDGTECKLDDNKNHGYSRCVQGECRHFGCDGISESTLRYDDCGVCNGDGSTCEVNSGVYDDKGVYKTYVNVVTIPKGSFNIVVRQRNVYCFISVVINGARVLNANGVKDNSRSISVSGVLLDYTTVPEKLEIRDKTPVDLVIQVYRNYSMQYLGVDPYVSYSYYRDKSNLRMMYAWASIPTLGCPVTCGSGEKEDKVECKDDSFHTVDDYHCDLAEKPSLTPRICTTQKCAPRWSVSEWSNCSVSCGFGRKTRDVKCVEEVNGHTVVTDASKCKEKHPIYMSACYTSNCTGYWSTGNWSECTRTCGEGYRERNVTCKANHQNNTCTLIESACEQKHRPDSVSKCNFGPCYIERDPNETCKDNGDDCKRWYDTDVIICEGSKKSYMSANCTKTCGLCSNDICFDQENCDSIMQGIDCRQVDDKLYRDWLFQNCPAKCGVCNEKANCYDDDSCYLYDTLYCHDKQYMRWMYRHCPQTCGVCRDCTDCSKFDTRYCNHNNTIAYMKKYCAQTCNFCVNHKI